MVTACILHERPSAAGECVTTDIRVARLIILWRSLRFLPNQWAISLNFFHSTVIGRRFALRKTEGSPSLSPRVLTHHA